VLPPTVPPKPKSPRLEHLQTQAGVKLVVEEKIRVDLAKAKSQPPANSEKN
jgi:hypothetical protein